MIDYNTLIVLLGAGLLGASAGLVGTFAVLRGRALTGDALAHAALPGLCVAFLATGQRSLPVLLGGALVSGIAGILVISALGRYTRTKEDASIGIVLSVFFGAGIVLSRLIQNRASTGSKAGLDSYILGKTAGMIAQDVLLIAGVAAACLAVIILLYKEFKVVIFDPSFAASEGWPVLLLDLVLMTLIAVTVVIGLPAVGVVLIAALLIIPGATARFWTDRLSRLLVLSAAFGLATGVVGTAASAAYSRLPAGPIIVLVGSLLFVVSMLAAPRRGLLARLIADRRFAQKWNERELWLELYALNEPHLPGTRVVTFAELLKRRTWTPRQLRARLRDAVHSGSLDAEAEDRFRLTRRGLQVAGDVVRNARLWDEYLANYADAGLVLAGAQGRDVREVLPPDMVDELTAALEQSGRWPATPRLGEGAA